MMTVPRFRGRGSPANGRTHSQTFPLQDLQKKIYTDLLQNKINKQGNKTKQQQKHPPTLSPSHSSLHMVPILGGEESQAHTFPFFSLQTLPSTNQNALNQSKCPFLTQ